MIITPGKVEENRYCPNSTYCCLGTSHNISSLWRSLATSTRVKNIVPLLLVKVYAVLGESQS